MPCTSAFCHPDTLKNEIRSILFLRLGNEKKKSFFFCISLIFFVSLQEFSAFLCIKAVWGIERKWGSCLGKRQSRATNWQPYSIPHSAINCFQCARPMVASLVEEHPTVSHQPFYGSSSGAKLRISEQNTKFI